MTEETLEEALARVAEQAWSGAKKQVELTNRTFRLDSVELTQFENQKGEPDEAYIGKVAVDGAEAEDYWLSGIEVMPQIAYLVEHESLPVFLTMIRQADKKGQPYRLLPVDDASPPATSPPAPTPSP